MEFSAPMRRNGGNLIFMTQHIFMRQNLLPPLKGLFFRMHNPTALTHTSCGALYILVNNVQFLSYNVIIRDFGVRDTSLQLVWYLVNNSV